jgi:hypothetical protein
LRPILLTKAKEKDMGKTEEWRWIPGYEGRYLISSEGRAISLPVPRGRPNPVFLKALDKPHTSTKYYALSGASGKVSLTIPNLVAAAFKEKNLPEYHGNQDKTHCPQGHEYTEENIYYNPSRPGVRHCKACRTAHDRKYKAQKRAKAVAA